ncbi:MAG: hypothetical protein PHN35_06900 [Clostridia bacterium]|nr:hypothetical protein [Clostridia bacterium]
MKAIIDVREWQATVDLKTGKPCLIDEKIAAPLRDLISRYPYPGDRNDEGADWVTAIAQETAKLYDPQFLYFNYNQPIFNGLYRPRQEEQRQRTIKKILADCQSFAEENNFALVLAGMGDTVPLKGYISEPHLKGLLMASAWSHYLGGLLQAEKGDLELLQKNQNVAAVIGKEELAAAYQMSENYYKLLPQYLLIAKEGYSFKGMFSHNQNMHYTECARTHLPVYSQIGYCGHIEGLNSLISTALDQGRKVLLVVVEGLGEADFTLPYQMLNNLRGQVPYNGYSLVYTLASGEKMENCPLPPLFDMTVQSELPRVFPLSMSVEKLPEKTIGCRSDLRTAAIGCRSMVTHTAINADLNIECYVRASNNMGVMLSLREEKLADLK